MSKSKLTKFIVLTRSRTGSNLLMSFLNSHPDISAQGEIFSRIDGRDYKVILEEAFGHLSPCEVKAKGFKIFYYHPVDGSSPGLWNALTSNADIKVIHLKRRNVLHTLISRKIAGITDVWGIRSGLSSQDGSTIQFTTEELKKGFLQTEKWEQRGAKMFAGHSLHTVYYEDLVKDRDESLRKIVVFLGLRYYPLKTNMVKQNRRTPRETISNYDALKAEFANTEYEKFFVD